MRVRLTPRIVVLALGAGILVSLAAAIGIGPNVSAQDAGADEGTEASYPTTGNPEVHGEWLVRCSGEDDVASVCEAYRNLFLTESEQRLLHVAVGHGAEEDAAVAILIAPLGVALAEGVSIRIDGGWPAEFDYVSCAADGCRARAPLDEGMLSAMQSGDEMRVIVAELSGRRISIPVSLDGFTAAFEAAEVPATN
ncbi:MAG: invasion associated locus B family protein [Pseudomonadota bacterium]